MVGSGRRAWGSQRRTRLAGEAARRAGRWIERARGGARSPSPSGRSPTALSSNRAMTSIATNRGRSGCSVWFAVCSVAMSPARELSRRPRAGCCLSVGTSTSPSLPAYPPVLDHVHAAAWISAGVVAWPLPRCAVADVGRVTPRSLRGASPHGRLLLLVNAVRYTPPCNRLLCRRLGARHFAGVRADRRS
ncbi:hypothetical protein BD310DRAFT_231334 [Dichomitus squalens]|uniref:Uncharacterized protein n=1 Tax=Dichomitus squalens TaxID=114155 RepID=A0A4Q9PC93_9APHY|nr:hypothetical protein BD310DRAFT_231334 [Dichomitus squalens]